MITNLPDLTPTNGFKQIFNLNDWNKKKSGYVTFDDLEDYASLYAGNVFEGALNVFQSIGFLNSINDVEASTFAYIKNARSDIQTQIDDIYEYTIEQLLLKRDLTNLDFDMINGISREKLTYLETITSDVQTQLDTKRNITNNIFNGDIQMRSTDGLYGLTIKPSWNSSTSLVDNTSLSMSGYSKIYIPSTIYPSYIVSASGAQLGSSTQMSRIRKNLNVDNCVRIGYNDTTNVTTLSNNSNLDVKGSVNITDIIYLGGINLKTYIDAQDATIRDEMENLPTSVDITNLETEISELETLITDLTTNKANVTYVDTAIANVYNASAELLQTIQEIQTELANDNATEVVIMNQLSQKLNITDYNTEKATMETTINTNNTTTTTNINTINTKLGKYINETETETTRINSAMSVKDKIAVNGLTCNELVVNKITAKEIVHEKMETKTTYNVLAYLYFNNRTYPIIKQRGQMTDFGFVVGVNNIYEITLYPKQEFAIYDGNNRVITKVVNNTEEMKYYEPITIHTGYTPNRYVIKNI